MEYNSQEWKCTFSICHQNFTFLLVLFPKNELRPNDTGEDEDSVSAQLQLKEKLKPEVKDDFVCWKVDIRAQKVLAVDNFSKFQGFICFGAISKYLSNSGISPSEYP